MLKKIGCLLLSIAALSGCGGGMNSPNASAPSSVNAHEATWVTYHRDPLINLNGATVRNTDGELLMDGALVSEHVIQCQVCHGSALMGAKGGAAGPACLDCHVLDPIKYPVMCYSCHGGWPIVPLAQYTTASGKTLLRNNGWPVQPLQQWFSTSRAKRGGMAMDQNFITRVRTSNIHLKHDVIPALPFDATLNGNNLSRNDECRRCHGYFRQDNLGTRHHNRMNQRQGARFVFNSATGPVEVALGGCLAPLSNGGCHTLSFGADDPFSPLDCLGCHARPVTAPH